MSPGILTVSIVAYGTLHFTVGIVATLMLATFIGQMVEWSWFTAVPLDSWLLSFYYLGLDYQIPPAVWIILILAAVSARYEHRLTSRGKAIEQQTDIEQVSELLDSERDRFLLSALALENSTILNGNVPMVRVILKSRKVYIGSVISCDVQFGKTKNIVLQPAHSGFISEDKLELELTEHYETFFQQRLKDKNLLIGKHSENVDATISKINQFYQQFAITIAIDEVVALSLFDMDEYQKLLEIKLRNLHPA